MSQCTELLDMLARWFIGGTLSLALLVFLVGFMCAMHKEWS